MGIQIERIKFQNYRQYGTGILELSAGGQYALTAFIAKNGTGKTTLLNAITWCLYEKEYQLSAADEALPEINSTLISSEHADEIIDVSVTLVIVDGGKIVEFERSKPFKINHFGGECNCVPGTSKFRVSITGTGDLENTGIYEDEEAEVLAKQYFDQAIYNFYFFDGEKLGEFFDVGKTKDIKTSIFNISQVTLLEQAKKHAESMRYSLSRKMSKDSPELDKLLSERQQLTDSISLNTRILEESQARITQLDATIKECDDQLSGYRPIKNLQEERSEKDSSLKELEKEEEKLISDRSVFIRKSIIVLYMYPQIKAVLALISKKEEAGDLPPSIDPVLIKKVLELHEKTCPFCDGEITDKSIIHLNKLLEQFTVSTATSNNLKEIKGSLEVFIEEAKQYLKTKNEFIDRLSDIETKKKKIEKRLEEISKLLSSFGDKEADLIPQIEEKRKDAIERSKTESRSLGAAEDQITQAKKRLSVIEEAIRKAEDKQKEHSSIQEQIKVLDMLVTNFEKIKNNIMNVMKTEISSTTWEIFRSMIWKQNTFGSIKIDDNYMVSVYDADGRKMTGSLGATEQMALAYAFTLAIHKASGKNCPLVIDSPLGRASDDNRANIAKALLEISEDKQIVLLFTPDEYSESVQNIYDGKARVNYLNLAADEKHIKEVVTDG